MIQEKAKAKESEQNITSIRRAIVLYSSPTAFDIPTGPRTPITIADDVIPLILSYCDASTLCRASSVSSAWHSIANNDEMWERLCRERFGVSSRELNPPPDPTKVLYILSYRRLKEVCRFSPTGTTDPFSGRRLSLPRAVRL
mmetsp:Transcript_32017/g.47121  ORF Transcript_32017/g.47121 Transcript_32017/m.47121 type:complete len:142 (-) Transcript_32017:353-778(-)